MKVTYKNIRHGYVRIDSNGEVQISIPVRLKNNEGFKNNLIEKGKILLARYHKKTHILTSDKDSVLLFGEKILFTDLYKQRHTPYTIKHTTKILKEILEEYTKPLLDKYTEKLSMKHRKLTIRKTSSKRGSCTHDQNISLSLNLVHLPTKYIQYVIIHEICHLKIKNHSKKFWALVESFLPEYKTIRKEMRKMVLK